MLRRFTATIGFFVDIGRDVIGTLRSRWRRFHARVVNSDDTAAVGVDVYPFFEQMTGVGWYEWNLLAALDRRNDGITYNLYARRSFDGGQTWTTTPASFVHTDEETYSGSGTTTCEWMGPAGGEAGKNERYHQVHGHRGGK